VAIILVEYSWLRSSGHHICQALLVKEQLVFGFLVEYPWLRSSGHHPLRALLVKELLTIGFIWHSWLRSSWVFGLLVEYSWLRSRGYRPLRAQPDQLAFSDFLRPSALPSAVAGRAAARHCFPKARRLAWLSELQALHSDIGAIAIHDRPLSVRVNPVEPTLPLQSRVLVARDRPLPVLSVCTSHTSAIAAECLYPLRRAIACTHFVLTEVPREPRSSALWPGAADLAKARKSVVRI
jgi:hypothetical protein